MDRLYKQSEVDKVIKARLKRARAQWEREKEQEKVNLVTVCMMLNDAELPLDLAGALNTNSMSELQTAIDILKKELHKI